MRGVWQQRHQQHRIARLFLACSFSSAAAAPPRRSVVVNGRSYLVPPPFSHTAALLLDGSSMDYLHSASLASLMPNYNSILSRTPATSASPSRKHDRHYTSSPSSSAGHEVLASASMPTYTNPNNVSVITGVPARIHGISGNWYWDREQQREVSMTSSSMIRCDTLLEALRDAGVDISIITVKDKLRGLLSKGLSGGDREGKGRVTCLSIERLDQCDPQALAGVDTRYVIRDIYDPRCSISALQLGVQLIRRNLSAGSPAPHLYYLSTTDYVQHKAAPGEPLANDFYAQLDGVIGQLHALQVPFALTADHGMTAKAREDGSPRVVYLGDVLASLQLHSPHRVVLPITDPHTVHHGSLGGFACVHVEHSAERARAMDALRAQRGVYTVMSATQAATALELPEDRIGDLVVLACRDWVLGNTEESHREGLRAVLERGGSGLRSHGGLDEMQVPLMVSRPVVDPAMRQRMMQGKMRNFDLFDVLLNGTQTTT